MLETQDLLLKKAVFEDWEDLYARVWRHWETARYMFWRVTESEEEAQDRMRRTLAYQASHEHVYTVYDRRSGRAIGFAGMRELEPGIWEETGVALGPDYVGRGYGGQILDALTRTAFARGGRLFRAFCREQNERSRRLILSRGFRPTGSEQCLDERTGETYTLLHFALTAPAAAPGSEPGPDTERSDAGDPRPGRPDPVG
ncbi:MAG: GNAT family N-acetyltransferase [Oscillospiraceae bacterium]|nr:GNAT family N-acetyltransferase [Oscillospiraceae bacterium]